MDSDEILNKMTPELYQVLKESLELGRWPDGRRLSAEQQETVLQALIIYEHQKVPEDLRTGYMPDICQSGAKSREAELDVKPINAESILRFKP